MTVGWGQRRGVVTQARPATCTVPQAQACVRLRSVGRRTLGECFHRKQPGRTPRSLLKKQQESLERRGPPFSLCHLGSSEGQRETETATNALDTSRGCPTPRQHSPQSRSPRRAPAVGISGPHVSQTRTSRPRGVERGVPATRGTLHLQPSALGAPQERDSGLGGDLVPAPQPSRGEEETGWCEGRAARLRSSVSGLTGKV